MHGLNKLYVYIHGTLIKLFDFLWLGWNFFSDNIQSLDMNQSILFSATLAIRSLSLFIFADSCFILKVAGGSDVFQLAWPSRMGDDLLTWSRTEFGAGTVKMCNHDVSWMIIEGR